jgi:hypothetical protein
LRRLIGLLEAIAPRPAPQADAVKARPALEDLRSWVDGYIAAATAPMNPRDASRFERAARDLARELVSHLASLAKRAPAEQAGRLPAAVARLDALARQLAEMLDRLAARDAATAVP